MKINHPLLLSMLLLSGAAIAGDAPTAASTATGLATSITPEGSGRAILEIKLPFELTNHMLIMSTNEPTTHLASSHDVDEGRTRQSLHLWATPLGDWKIQVTGPAGTTVHIHAEYADLKSDLTIKLP